VSKQKGKKKSKRTFLRNVGPFRVREIVSGIENAFEQFFLSFAVERRETAETGKERERKRRIVNQTRKKEEGVPNLQDVGDDTNTPNIDTHVVGSTQKHLGSCLKKRRRM
jgi:hypothetical protein